MESIIVDLNGALLQSRPFDEAHKKWFEMMSQLLKNEKIAKMAFAADWFEHVNDIMDSYLGDVGRDYKTMAARTIYGMAVVAEIRESDLVEEFVNFLYGLKDRYEICLVTTVPEPEPILDKLKISDLFDVVYKNPLEKTPDKLSMVKELIEDHEPAWYIGHGDKDMKGIGELGIKTVSVSWVKKGLPGDYMAENVKDMEQLI